MIYNLHILRILAAAAVVYVHICSGAGLGLTIGAGNFGVDVFFVISGFTISYVGQMTAGKFLLRRLIRIVPFYWAASLGTFLVALIAPNRVMSSSSDLTHLLCSLFFVPHLNKVGRLDPILALGWTLNYEMYFYFLFALALLFSIRWAPVICGAFMLSIAGLILISGTTNPVLLLYAEPIVLEFLAGAALFFVFQSESVKRWATACPTETKLALFGVGTAAAVFLPTQEFLWDSERAWRAGIPAFFLVAAAVLLEKFHGFAVKHKATVLFGDASYVLYLTHPYVVYGFIRLLVPKNLGTLGVGVTIVACLVVATGVAIGVHWVFERPVMAKLRQLLMPRRPSGSPQGAVLAS